VQFRLGPKLRGCRHDSGFKAGKKPAKYITREKPDSPSVPKLFIAVDGADFTYLSAGFHFILPELAEILKFSNYSN
jgi:hypothetical protein